MCWGTPLPQQPSRVASERIVKGCRSLPQEPHNPWRGCGYETLRAVGPQQSRDTSVPRTCPASWTLTPRPVTAGLNNHGQVGDGRYACDPDGNGVFKPVDGCLPAVVDVGTDKSVGSVGAGMWHTCATIFDKKDKINNELKCWGAHPLPHQPPKGGRRVDLAGLKRLADWRIAPLRGPSHFDSLAAIP